MFCSLQMPDEFPAEASLHRELAQLNRMEMEPWADAMLAAWGVGRSRSRKRKASRAVTIGISPS
jgi:hypothetical protein